MQPFRLPNGTYLSLEQVASVETHPNGDVTLHRQGSAQRLTGADAAALLEWTINSINAKKAQPFAPQVLK